MKTARPKKIGPTLLIVWLHCSLLAIEQPFAVRSPGDFGTVILVMYSHFDID
jgi:hypothetical protein